MISINKIFNNLIKTNTKLCHRFVSTESSNLAQLRRKTGYAFNLCRKALDIHGQDIQKAEHWLRAEAVKNGWERALKIQNRKTSEGLIGVFTSNDRTISTMIELNCETDFVARNQLFTELVSSLTERLSQTSIAAQHSDNGNLSKIKFGSEELRQLEPELVLDAIGKLGENIKLTKGCVFVNNKFEENVQLVGYTHAVGGRVQSNHESIILGKYGTIIALKTGPVMTEEGVEVIKSVDEVEEIGKQLAQHIIGLNPSTIGPISDVSDMTQEDDEPTELLRQQFVFDEDITVEEFLKQSNIKVLDFERFECGVN